MQRAEQLIKQAEKALESGWFTKRDPDTGMDAYLKAANLLRTENPLRASECYVKAAELQQELNSLFLSAKSFEQAAALCGDPKLYKRASDMYLVHGSGDRAAEMLEKAALMQDASTAAGKQQALELYKESLEIYSSEDKLRFSLDTHRNAIKFSIANSLLQDAIQLSKQLELVMIKISNRPGAFKQALSTLVLNVHINNANAQQEWGESCSRNAGLADSDEGHAALELFQYLENGGKLENRVFRYLDTEVAKIALNLKPGTAKMTDLQDEIEEEGFL